MNDRYCRYEVLWGVLYMMAMGVCGIVLVALGSTLPELTKSLHASSISVGSIFIARGVGAIIGAVASAKLFKWFKGTRIIVVSLAIISVTLWVLPFTSSIAILHNRFFLMGLGTSITDTGCQIMTRKLHGNKAGPWFGANTISFGVAGSLVPVIALISKDISVQCRILALMVAGVALIIAINPQVDENASVDHNNESLICAPHYYVEITVAAIVFSLVGGQVTVTAYASTYVTAQMHWSKDTGSQLLMMIWASVTVGRLGGIWDQQTLLSDDALRSHLAMAFTMGSLAAALILLQPYNALAVWIGFACYGLFNGPCLSYCYDLNNRITVPSEQSMAIVMFGLNFGASLVPYLTALVWDHGGGPPMLILSTLLSMLLPLPLLQLAQHLQYDKIPLLLDGSEKQHIHIDTEQSQQYGSLVDTETPDQHLTRLVPS